MSDTDAVARLNAAGLVAAVRGRASVRRFLPDAVPRDDIAAMVELAVRAANASNAQMWRFIAVDDPQVRAAMKDAVNANLDGMAAWPEVAPIRKDIKGLRAFSTFFAAAPVAIAVCCLPYATTADAILDRRGIEGAERARLRPDSGQQSIGAAVQVLCTAAHAMGYGTCWMTGPVLAAPALEALLGVEPPARLVAIVPLGRPMGKVEPSSRLPVEDVLEYR